MKRNDSCWPPYESRPQPDSDKYGAELGNALKILDKAWDHAPDRHRRKKVDEIRNEIRKEMLRSIEEEEEDDE